MELKALIETLAQRTQARGCTAAEEDEAARKIGRLIMQYGLPGSAVAQQQPIRQQGSTSAISPEQWGKIMAEWIKQHGQQCQQQRPYPFEGLGSAFVGDFWKFTG